MRVARTYISETPCSKGHVVRYRGSRSCQQCNIDKSRARKAGIKTEKTQKKKTGGKPKIIKSMPAMANFLAGKL